VIHIYDLNIYIPDTGNEILADTILVTAFGEFCPSLASRQAKKQAGRQARGQAQSSGKLCKLDYVNESVASHMSVDQRRGHPEQH
jgi:hypothetical protein